MKKCLSIVAVLWVWASVSSADVSLINEKVLWPADSEVKPLPNPGAVRLSDDGKKLLWMKIEKPPGETPGPRKYRLVLRELETGQETVLPLAAAKFDDPIIMLLSRPIFSPDSRTLTIFVPEDANDNGVWDHESEKLRLGFYDIATKKLTKRDLSAGIILPAYMGKGVLVLQWEKEAMTGSLKWLDSPEAEPRKLSLSGLPAAVCPTAPLAAVLVPQFPEAKDGAKPGRPTFALKMLDVQADKVTAELPMDPQNSHLDDYAPQFTADGKFMYYYDVEGKGDARKELIRVWDVQGGKVASVLEECRPIGPGPGGTMVINRGRGPREGTLFVHDPAANQWTAVMGGKAIGMWAGNGRVIFARQGEDRKTSIHLAELKME